MSIKADFVLKKTYQIKHSILVIILLLFAGKDLVKAGNRGENENTFGISLSLTEYQTRELVLNKTIHRGLLPSFGLSYNIPYKASYHSIDLYMTFNTLKSDFEKEDATFATGIDISYLYAQKIMDINPNISLFAGGIIGSDYNIAYYENWDESHFYWLSSYFLGLDCTGFYKNPDGSYFSLEIQTPVFALVSRPPKRFLSSEINPEFSSIIGKMHDDLDLTSFQHHLDFKLNMAYNFRYSDYFSQTVSWQFRYLRNVMPYSKRINILVHTFSATFLF